jgi:hypothetical protein
MLWNLQEKVKRLFCDVTGKLHLLPEKEKKKKLLVPASCPFHKKYKHRQMLLKC